MPGDAMRKHWQLCSAILIALAAGCSLFLITKVRRPHITEEACERVEVGMTRAEVEHLLGGPPGCYTNRLIALCGTGSSDGTITCEWIGSEGMIVIHFAADPSESDGIGRVVRRRWDPFPPETFVERIRSLFPRK